MSEIKKRLKHMYAILLCGILLGGCGSIANEVPQVTEEVDKVMQEEQQEKDVAALEAENYVPDDGIISQAQMETIAGVKGTYHFNGKTEDGITYQWAYDGEKIQNPQEQALLVKTSAQGLDDVKAMAGDAPYALEVTLQEMNLAAPAVLTLTLNKKWDADRVLYLTRQNEKLVKVADAAISEKEVKDEKVTQITFDVTMTGGTFYLVGGSSGKSDGESQDENKAKNNKDSQNGKVSGTQDTAQESEEEESQGDTAQEEVLTCTISIDCATILDNWDDLNEAKAEFVPSDGWILYPSEVEFTQGETVFDILKRVCNDAGIHMSSRYTPIYGSYYIEGMNQLYEFDCGSSSGWMFNVNGWYPNYGCSSYTVENGDVIEWRYTCNREDGVGDKVGGTS